MVVFSTDRPVTVIDLLFVIVVQPGTLIAWRLQGEDALVIDFACQV